MIALIHEAMVLQVEADGEDFPVAPPMFWTVCPDTTQAGYLFDVDTNIFSAPPKPTSEELDAEELARIAADLDRIDNQVALELLLPLYAAVRELLPDFETKPYFPPWLAGVTTKADFRQAVIDRRKALRDAP